VSSREVDAGEPGAGGPEPADAEAPVGSETAESAPVDADALPGVPDAFGRLWTPHRMAYIRGENKPATDQRGTGECPFCRAPEGTDEDRLIVARGELAFVVLNLYPYSPGHLMVVPYRHVADYPALDAAECAEIAALLQRAMTVVREVSGAQGFNIGMNQGEVAGAGIAAHLHQHLVPRWVGDTNFMPIIGRTRVLPQLLADTRAMLADAWAADASAR
jgi:ATP adenylyltransferase